MNINTEQIKLLREKTGAGMLNCKNALIETNGDFEKAVLYLREKGLISADKKLFRSTKQGIVTSYIHTGSKLGVLLELNCETDFVARRVEFSELAKTLAMQIASNSNIQYISLNDIPQKVWQKETETESNRDDILTKPEAIKASIVQGRVEKILKTYTLSNQSCIREPESTVEEYIKKYVALLGENIKIGRVCKFLIGQDIILIQQENVTEGT